MSAHADATAAVRRVLTPDSVAVIGASENPAKFGGRIMRYLTKQLSRLHGLADEVKARGRRCVRLAKNRFAVGSPAQVVDALLAQHTAGVTHATMRVSCPGEAAG